MSVYWCASLICIQQQIELASLRTATTVSVQEVVLAPHWLSFYLAGQGITSLEDLIAHEKQLQELKLGMQGKAEWHRPAFIGKLEARIAGSSFQTVEAFLALREQLYLYRCILYGTHVWPCPDAICCDSTGNVYCKMRHQASQQ